MHILTQRKAVHIQTHLKFWRLHSRRGGECRRPPPIVEGAIRLQKHHKLIHGREGALGRGREMSAFQCAPLGVM